MTATDQPDDLTALIAATLVRAHAATKATPEQLAARTPDFLPLAVQVRDALSAEGWLNDDEDRQAARQMLNFPDVQKLLQDKASRLAAIEREKHEAVGAARERRLWLEGKGNA